MSKKKDSQKGAKAGQIVLSPEEAREMEMILDRLQVQSPEGESLPSFLQSLRQALADREPLASALIEEIGRHPSDVGYKAFISLRDLFSSKQYRRLVRQVEYRLSQRGYVAEAPVTPAEARIVLIHKEERKAVAHVIPDKDSFGLVGTLVPGGQFEGPSAIFTMIYGGLRYQGIKIVESSQKAYKEFLQKTSERFSVKPYEIPVWHAARLFHDALRFSVEPSEHARVEEAKQLYKPYYDPDRPPYVYDLMPPVQDPDREIVKINPVELLENLNSYSLLFKKEDIEPYFQKIISHEQSVLVISQGIKEQRTSDIIGEAADKLCTGLVREHHERFFEEMALRFKQYGEEEYAMAAWTTAQQLRSPALASRNSVITTLVFASMEKYWPEEFDYGEQETDSFERTESGLIIPK